MNGNVFLTDLEAGLCLSKIHEPTPSLFWVVDPLVFSKMGDVSPAQKVTNTSAFERSWFKNSSDQWV